MRGGGWRDPPCSYAPQRQAACRHRDHDWNARHARLQPGFQRLIAVHSKDVATAGISIDDHTRWYAREKHRGIVDVGRLCQRSRRAWSTLQADVAVAVEGTEGYPCRMDRHPLRRRQASASACARGSPANERAAINLKPVEHRLGLPEVGGIEAFREPIIDWLQQIAGITPLALLAPQTC
jgi:hypothetical protein